MVTGSYTSFYVEDGNGDYYWDLGDGRIYKTVDSVDDLDQTTLSTCDYQIQYRGDFGDDPSLDNGWIRNNIKCRTAGEKGVQTYSWTFVHETDPRYTGERTPIWGSWEYHTNVVGGVGNLEAMGHLVG